MSTMRRHSWRCALVAALLGLTLGPALASAQEEAEDEPGLEIGVIGGGGFFHMNQPNDQPGDTTFLYGSAFAGGGGMFGVSVTYPVIPLLSVGGEVLYGISAITGDAEAESFRREITIGQQSLRITPLVRLNVPLGILRFEVGGGPEFVITTSSAIEEIIVGGEAEPPIETEHNFAVYLMTQLGVALDFGRISIPFTFRAGWNPGYPDTTADRFASFQSPDDPGPLTVGVDWYVAGITGVRFEL
ncbi:MAG: hypothetical protein KC561_02340 [Myxococcales bacterium]|nr:hypothetical protein [Myxococcales bacterium]